MKNNFITVDPLGYQAHTSFVKQAIASWGLAAKPIVVSSSMQEGLFEGNPPNVKALPPWLNRAEMFVPQNRIWFLFCQILIMGYVLLRVLFGRVDTVILLSYYLPVFTLYSWLFSLVGKRVIVVEHNTLVPTSKLKQLAFRMISPRVTHICFEEYIAEFVSKIYKRASAVVRIPLTNSFPASTFTEVVGAKRRIVFMPSSTVSPATSEEIESAFAEAAEYVLYCKGEPSVKRAGVVKQKFFDNYSDLISESHCVLIPQPFDYRVSGVFYEALLGDSTIAVADARFGRAMAEKYPERVVVVSEWSDISSVLDGVTSAPALGITQEEWNEASGKEFASQFPAEALG
jgi:hypothetical protein